MRVLVTGAGGQLGSTMVRRLRAGHDVVAMTHAQLDITRLADVLRAARDARPDAIVNCAAYNEVDRAEDDAQAAITCNALGVRALARAAAEQGAALVHYSTDFVFDGEANEPYDEDALPSPKSVYAQSKLLGEWFAADAPRYYVLRVESLFGGEARHSSIDRIVEALRSGGPARVFTDRVVSPSYVEDVVTATERLLLDGIPSGLYHCVNSGYASWYEVGLAIARLLEVTPSALDPISVRDVALRAPRPRFCALSNARLRAAGISMPDWQDALRRHLQRS
ncbi:MAG TPA: dTDP-4-dehydrorhamnose reductase [Vicinamibacterales bacterium]|nr:dTDP-4-dehydrorhamnose reductase [Vicinamibacterales bacterium]